MSGYKPLLTALLAFPFTFLAVIAFAFWMHALVLAAQLGWSSL